MSQHYLAIIEDDVSIRESLRLFTEAKTTISVIGEYGSVEAFLEADFVEHEPSLVFLDIGLPGMSGIKGIPHIKKKVPSINIVMLTTYEEDDKIFDALCAGACSYISKRTPLTKIMEALTIVSHGGSYMSPSIARKVTSYFMKQPQKPKTPLSPRQLEIVEHIVAGKTYTEIADLCYISLNTVRTHIKRIYDLLQINNKVSLISKYNSGEI